VSKEGTRKDELFDTAMFSRLDQVSSAIDVDGLQPVPIKLVPIFDTPGVAGPNGRKVDDCLDGFDCRSDRFWIGYITLDEFHVFRENPSR
jgi:hypothetical protein